MGVKKGTDNAAAWRNDGVKVRKKIVSDALIKISQRKDKVKSEKELVELLVLATGINRTTFTRSTSKYKEMIYTFLNQQSGASGAVSIDSMNLDTLRIHAKMKNLETEDLRKKVNALEKEIKIQKEVSSVGDITDISDTVMALLVVVERFRDFIQLDFKSKSILDTTKYEGDPDRVIVSGIRTKALFNTLKANPMLAGDVIRSDELVNLKGDSHE